MKKNDYAGVYLPQYDGTDVTITAIADFTGVSHRDVPTGCIVCDLSDGTHWLLDDTDAIQTTGSLTDVFDLIWSENSGWMVLQEDGSSVPISWL